MSHLKLEQTIQPALSLKSLGLYLKEHKMTGQLHCAGAGRSRHCPPSVVPAMVRLHCPYPVAQAYSGVVSAVVLDRCGADVVFLVADVGAGHTVRRPGILCFHAFVMGLYSDLGWAGISS